MSRKSEHKHPSIWRIVMRFAPHIRKERTLVIGASFCMFAEVAFRLLEPWPLKFVFDAIIVSDSVKANANLPAFIARMSTAEILTWSAVAIVFIAILRAVASYARRVGFTLAGNRVLTVVRNELFAHLQRLSLSFHRKNRTGDLITRVTGDIGRLQEVVSTALLPLLANMLTLVGMLGIMAWMNWRLSLVALAVLPVFLLSTKRIGGNIRTVARRQRERFGDMGAATAETIGAIGTVQALGLEDARNETFAAQNASSLKEGVQGKRLAARLLGVADVLIAIGSALVLWYGGRLVVEGAITPGDLIVFLAYLKKAFRPMRDLAKFTGRLAKAGASAERVIEILDTVPLIVEAPGAVPAPEVINTLAFEGVSFAYEPDRPALLNASFDARVGQLTALVGHSGAGKSTIINLLLRLYDPDEGIVRFDGHDLRQLTIDSLRQRITVVPQESVLFGLSIRDNIAYGLRDMTDDAIADAARLANAHDFIARLPDGYHTVVGERGETLSQGQRQRIAIARAAIRHAPIVILDEPTANLDPHSRDHIHDAIRNLCRDRIGFIIAHAGDTVRLADQIIVLDHGRIVEIGSHDSLMAAEGTYHSLFAAAMDPTGATP